MSPQQVREDCRRLVNGKIKGQLGANLIGWLDRADAKATRRNDVAHAIWLRVDKPEPGSVAYVHFGRRPAHCGYTTVEQIKLTALDRMGMEIESVADFGLGLLAAVEAYLAATCVEVPPPPSRGPTP